MNSTASFNSSLNLDLVDERNSPWYRNSLYRCLRTNLPVSMIQERSLHAPGVMFLSLDENILGNKDQSVSEDHYYLDDTLPLAIGDKSRDSASSFYLNDTVPLSIDEELEYETWEQVLLHRSRNNGELLRSLDESSQWCDQCSQYKCHGLKCCKTATSEQLQDLIDRLRMGEDVVVPVLTYSLPELSELLDYSADMSHSVVSSEGDCSSDEASRVRGFPCLQRMTNQKEADGMQRVECDTCSSEDYYSAGSETASQDSFSEDSWIFVGDIKYRGC